MASQTGKQPRIPPLRAVIVDGDAQRLLLPDQDDQPLASRMPCKKLLIGSPEGGYQEGIRGLSHERIHALGVILEIHKAVAVVQFHLKLPEHRKPQKAGNLRPGVAAHGGEV